MRELVSASLAQPGRELTASIKGCGGCVPLVTSIFKAEMKKAGHATNNK